MRTLQDLAALGPHGARVRDAVAAIADAAVAIAQKLARAAVEGALGASGAVNVQGEEQQKLDVIADELVFAKLAASGAVAAIGSEERPQLETVEHAEGNLLVLVDPLDGSSNLDVNGAVGTIFTIYEAQRPIDPQAALRPGREALAAGYVMYGPGLVLVLTVGEGTHGFSWDAQEGRWVLTHPDMRIPDGKGYYSVNEAYAPRWSEDARARLARMKEETKLGLRYVGAMVADVHRTLLKGGIFLYPPDTKNPQGKLRLMYEAIPMAMLVEAAGGMAVAEQGKRILDIAPEALHQRTPVYLGSPSAVRYFA